MNTEESKLEPQQEQLDIPVVINWRLLINLLLFKDKRLSYSKDVKIGIGILLWLDVVGVGLLIWTIMFFIACL